MLLPNPEAVGTLLFIEDVRLELLAVVLPHFRFKLEIQPSQISVTAHSWPHIDTLIVKGLTIGIETYFTTPHMNNCPSRVTGA